MTAMTYDFPTQLVEGQEYERRLDEHFRKFRVQITPATMEQQRQGIDRVFFFPATGSRDTIEYKADSIAGKTGNAFIETVSVDTPSISKPGWAVTSQAKYLVYMVTDPEAIYLVLMANIKAMLPKWRERYPTKAAQNNGYRTLGVVVPITELERIAICVW